MMVVKWLKKNRPPLPTIVSVPQTDGCDNLNQFTACSLPVDAFLREDNSTVTGYRVNYAENTFPSQVHLPDKEKCPD